MNCTKCGVVNESTYKFCKNCGNKLFEEKTNKASKKIKLSFIFIIITVLLIVCLAGTLIKKSGGKRVILIYMVGSNLESEYGLATKDLSEIKSSNLNLNDTKIIVYTGGTKTWHGSYENDSIYELTDNGYKQVKKYDSLNTGEAVTLLNFIDYVTDNYKADKYGLIFWDHGGGPILGYGSDEIYENDSLTLKEIYSSLGSSKYLKTNKFEFIGFDACLMASIEVGSMVSKYTDYMIASEEVEPGYGWDYSFLGKINSSVNVEDFAKLIIDYTYNFYDKLSNTYLKDFDITLSVMDLRQIKEVENNLSILFKDVDVTLLNSGYSEIVKYITRSTSFGYNGVDKSYDLIDMKQMSESLEEKYGDNAKKLTNSIDKLIIYQKSSIDGANGVSIYYPYYTKKLISKFMPMYDELNFSEEYKSFLKNYIKILTGSSIVTSNFKSILLDLADDKVSVTLSDEIVENYNRAKYVIFRDMKDGYYMPIYSSSDVELDSSNVLYANFNKKQLAVIDDERNTGFATMLELSRTSNQATYAIPILIYKYKDKFQVEDAAIILKVDDEHPNGYVASVSPYINASEIENSKELIDLNEWEVIQFFNSEYKIFDSKGNYTSDWEGSGNYYLAEFKTTEKYTIEFIDLDEDYDYYCMFQIEDTQGNTHHTNLIKID